MPGDEVSVTMEGTRIVIEPLNRKGYGRDFIEQFVDGPPEPDAFPDRAQKEVHRTNVAVAEQARFLVGKIDDPLGTRGKLHVLRLPCKPVTCRSVSARTSLNMIPSLSRTRAATQSSSRKRPRSKCSVPT